MVEVKKSENKMVFLFNNTNKGYIKSEEDEKLYRNSNIRQFCEKEIIVEKVEHHCPTTGKYKAPAHQKCNDNVTQKQSKFIPFALHKFSNYLCHLFFRNLIDKRKDKRKFDNVLRTNEEQISVTYGFLRILDSYWMLSMGLDETFLNH